jgi:capsular polysaccharide biosynthesis protein
MQLRDLLAILWRFWLLIVLVPALAGGVSLLLALRQPVQYQAAARLMITQTPFDPAGQAELPDYNNTYSWLVSEYILDDLPQVLSSNAFAVDLTAQRARADVPLASLSAEVLHRSVRIVATADTPEPALDTLQAAITTLQQHGLKYWDRLPPSGPGIQVAVLDPPTPLGSTVSNRAIVLNVALRTALALAAAVALALALNYLDNRVRSPRQAEQATGVPVLATIPKE